MLLLLPFRFWLLYYILIIVRAQRVLSLFRILAFALMAIVCWINGAAVYWHRYRKKQTELHPSDCNFLWFLIFMIRKWTKLFFSFEQKTKFIANSTSVASSFKCTIFSTISTAAATVHKLNRSEFHKIRTVVLSARAVLNRKYIAPLCASLSFRTGERIVYRHTEYA